MSRQSGAAARRHAGAPRNWGSQSHGMVEIQRPFPCRFVFSCAAPFVTGCFSTAC